MQQFFLLKKQAVPRLVQQGKGHLLPPAQPQLDQMPFLGGKAGKTVEVKIPSLAKTAIRQGLGGGGQQVFVIQGQAPCHAAIGGVQQPQVPDLASGAARLPGGLQQLFRLDAAGLEFIHQAHQPFHHLGPGTGGLVVFQGVLHLQDGPVHGQHPAAGIQPGPARLAGLLQDALGRPLEGQHLGPPGHRVAAHLQQPPLHLVGEHFRHH